MVETRKMLLDLPFVAENKDGTLDLWRVQPTGWHTLDIQTGCGYARSFIEVCKTLDNPTIFHHVCDAARATATPSEDAIRRGFLLGLGSLIAASPRGHLATDALLPKGAYARLSDLPFVSAEGGVPHIFESDFRSGGSYSDDVARGAYYGAALAKYIRDTRRVSAGLEVSKAVLQFGEPALGIRVGLNTAFCQYAMAASHEGRGPLLSAFDCTPVEITARFCPA